MFGFDQPEYGSQERFEKRAEAFKRQEKPLPVVRHYGWWLVHNCVAHMLIGLCPIRPFFRFHDWTSEKLAAGEEKLDTTATHAINIIHNPNTESINISKEQWEALTDTTIDPSTPIELNPIQPLYGDMIECPFCGGMGYHRATNSLSSCYDCNGSGEVMFKTG